MALTPDAPPASDAVVVVELPARPPEEADAELPGGLRQGVEVLSAVAEVVEQVAGEVGRRPLADADHADVRAAHDAHGKLRDLQLE